MPNATTAAVRKSRAGAPGHQAPGPEAARAEADPRVARTTRALGRALVELIQERAFDAITVQDILDRAGVGRTAFYAHYRNKHDVLFTSYDGLFAAFEPLVDRPSPYGSPGARLFPVAEFLTHVGERDALVRALGRDGLLDESWALLAGHAARIIGGRLGVWAARGGSVARGDDGTHGDVLPNAALTDALLARMLAGALVESVQWWHAHRAAATPAAVDAAFHALARGALQRAAW